ncbi:MAG: hypothetical protein QM737_07885 [Ferruginibacter sp.]
MRRCLFPILISTTLFSSAGKTTVQATGETSSSACEAILPAALLISALIAGTVFLLEANNKRRDKK